MNVMGKESTKTIKAVAIVLMILHHFWAFGDNWISGSQIISIESLSGFPFEKLVGAFGKICVGLFAFVTGYAFFAQKKKYQSNKIRLEKIVRFLLYYWIIYLIELLLGLLAKEPLPPIGVVLQNLFGFSSKVFEYGTGYVSSCFAWYVYFYILLMVTYPIITKEFGNSFWRSLLIPMIIAVGANMALEKLQNLPVISPLLNDYFEYMPVVVVGYNIARFNIIGKLTANFKQKYNALLLYVTAGILFCVCFILKVKIAKVFGINIDVICAPILIYVIESIRIGFLERKKCKTGVVERIVGTLAKESTNIWFLHAIFFTPYRSYQFLALWPRASFLIIIWVLILLIGASKIISFFQNLVWYNLTELIKAI